MVWALGPRGYVADRFNVFDGIIVVFSILELLLSALGSVQGLGGVVSSLRFFRLLRVLKLAKVRRACAWFLPWETGREGRVIPHGARVVLCCSGEEGSEPRKLGLS